MKITVLRLLFVFLVIALMLTVCIIIFQAKKSTTAIPAQNISKAVNFSLCTTDKCRDEYYAWLAEAKGPKGAFDDLKARYETDAYVQAECHQMVHAIGRAAVKRYKTVSEAYAKGDSFCWSGYYHGVMEAILSNQDPKTLPEKINTLCADIPGKVNYLFDYYNCVHGLGHGVMYVNDNRLFDALEQCDYLNTDFDRTSCYSGVFMENVMTDNKNHFTEYLKPDQPLYPCSAVLTKYKYSCYMMQTSYMLKISSYNFTRVFQFCSVVYPPFDAVCYQSLGRDASGNSVSDVQKTKETCLLGTNYFQRSNCVIGAVKDFISYFHSDTQAMQFCDSLPDDLRHICVSTARDYYRVF